MCLWVAAAGSSAAQTLAPPVERPEQGLFDRAPGTDRNLEVTAIVASAYDDNLAAENGSSAPDPHTQVSGFYDSVAGRVSFMKRFHRFTLALSEGSTFRYYPSLGDLASMQHAGTAGVQADFGRTHMDVNGTLELVPFFGIMNQLPLFDPGLGGLPTSTADLAAIKRDQRSSNAAASVRRAIGRNSSISGSANYAVSRFLDDGTGRTTGTAGGRLSKGLNRDFSFVAGYAYNLATYRVTTGPPQITELHNIDVGFDFNRALGPTHRTTIGFTTGTAAMTYPGGRREYSLTGDFRLNREIGRTGHAAAAYKRGVGFVAGFPQPFFADTVTADVGGLITRTVSLTLSGGYSKGQLGLVTSNNNTENYTGNVQVRRALSRRASLRAEYHFYHYRFDQTAGLPEGMPPQLSRQGLRVGFDLWLPLVR